MKIFVTRLSIASLVCVASIVSADDDPNWVRIKLDERFRSEGAAAADLNNDGSPDVVAGDVWYAAPPVDSADHTDASKWKLHEVRMPGDFVAGKGYSNSFANAAWDFNKDGWMDVVLIGFPGDPFHWYQNPGKDGGHWKEHIIWTSICNESPEFEDLNDDGTPEFLFGSQPEAQMGFIQIPDKSKVGEKFAFHAVSEPSAEPADAKNRGLDNGTFKYYHGLGAGDMNNDGHRDVIIAHGWWESPGDLSSDATWKFHPIRIKVDGKETPLPRAANIYADDLDMDGDADLFLSSAHEYGVWWAENKGDNGWDLHEIDKSYSQTHAVEQVDINGDGQLDYVTGKRFFAHNGNDPGGNDEVVMYWYEVKRTKGQAPTFVPHEILAGKGTGVGTQFEIHDMNKDGKPDIVLSNKKGVNVLLQK
ncbi:FG-GAP repeat domain-containing protein [Fuerstiella marisgermanici]|uniref:FG-GAP repeat n=1 Tax=Fuerstiella marisgermanici TaxID=1891926 RepID=A0A1P8WLX5_9PLAN|nr:VCBS repeat-containing protein [Fuerstiella marisgermanici]APZ95054.1 FG-GAP repeat [Fuerstiella marisgermanici]